MTDIELFEEVLNETYEQMNAGLCDFTDHGKCSCCGQCCGDIPINPIKVMYALPEDISNADFIAVLIELVRISDAVMLIPGWEHDLASSIAKTNAERSEKEIKWRI